MSGTVGIVFVSHSSQLAARAVALAGQMAPSVTLLAAGSARASARSWPRSAKPTGVQESWS